MSSRLWMSRGSTSSRLPRDILSQSDIAGSLPKSHHNNNHYQQVRWQIMERWSNIAVIALTNFVPYLMLPLGSPFSATRSGSSQCLAALPNPKTDTFQHQHTNTRLLPSIIPHVESSGLPQLPTSPCRATKLWLLCMPSGKFLPSNILLPQRCSSSE